MIRILPLLSIFLLSRRWLLPIFSPPGFQTRVIEWVVEVLVMTLLMLKVYLKQRINSHQQQQLIQHSNHHLQQYSASLQQCDYHHDSLDWFLFLKNRIVEPNFKRYFPRLSRNCMDKMSKNSAINSSLGEGSIRKIFIKGTSQKASYPHFCVFRLQMKL